MSDVRRTFDIGTEKKELFYSQAAAIRLTGSFDESQLADYILSVDFYIRALQVLVLGKEFKDATIDEVLDQIEELGLTDEQGQEIVAWVTDKVLNFMQTKLKNLQEKMNQIMPQLIESSRMLDGLENEIIQKQSI